MRPGLAVVLLLGCAPASLQRRPVAPLEARFRAGRARAPATAATSVYRDLLARSLYSRCRMWPTDSVAFDVHARRCGALSATVHAAARLLLEREARPEYLAPVALEGRIRWLDLPTSCDR